LIQGVLLGVVLGAATAWLLENLDKTVKTPQQARTLLPYPVLGSIPTFRGSKLVVRDNPSAPVSEAFRMLQANLRFLSADRQLKVIVVASATAKEGKSTIAANLAAATAQLGRRVLLVDVDLRHPAQHQLWELPNEVGLSNVLGREVEFSEAVAEVMPNLDVLTSGELPSNPVTLIDSSQMAVLIGNSSQNYDLVIVDTPPLTLAADATVLGKMTDGILMAVRPGVADSGSVAAAKELLSQSNQTVLGLAINGTSAQAISYSSTVGASAAIDRT
jgi:capsular exopolysaccharide synthesis family protein